ncbi:gasdermin [Dinghuibacter silviterrae]|uniref:Gasdermin bGSDM n=1 Tax=Dinghuibacter silviterrae TaxID=1539049 RepID=A0A4V3GL01_9BACT|nr:hypothetical protein [Dinghuibacter silviterrae]TDW97632.1 hypothetical protein EDB95_5483 [Dinghuibacter silviterrae]
MSNLLKNFLEEYGYNIVALPKEDIKPLTLLCQDGVSVISLDSSISTLFTSDEKAPPSVLHNTITGDIVGSTAASFDSTTGVSLLSWLLDKLKVGKLEGKVDIDSNKVLTFKYQEVREDKIKLGELDGYLTEAAPVKNKFRTYEDKLRKSALFVINSVLKSNSFTVTIEDKSGAAVDVAATIKGIADISQNIKVASKNSISVTSPGETFLVFAFKAQHIFFDRPGFWATFFGDPGATLGFTIKNATGLVLRGEEDFPAERLPVFAGQAVLR